jgi:hypothetical protein
MQCLYNNIYSSHVHLTAMPGLEVLKPSPRASGLLGRALAVGDQLDGFLCALDALQKQRNDRNERKQ